MSGSVNQPSNTIFYEMMAHPALFTHTHPQTVAVFGNENESILNEIIKHTTLTKISVFNKNDLPINHIDSKITYYSSDPTEWKKKVMPHSMDIIIHAAPPSTDLLKNIFNLLRDDGILMQQSSSPFEIIAIKSLSEQLRSAGFKNQQILSFPQPEFSSGWRSIIMATKQAVFKRIQEKAIFTRPFKTYYYNLDTHKASLVLPEFMRAEGVI
ncbi:MAG: speE 1 [Gammaproteobacteria bacterium]|jgi:spermidine synthase|nr:speE 1 [Gammaproteobacteria bacterium]